MTNPAIYFLTWKYPSRLISKLTPFPSLSNQSGMD